MPKKPHRRLPDLDLLHSRFDYDPTTGGLFHKGAEQIEMNAIGSWTKTGHKIIGINRQMWLVHRIVYFMYHRKDPGQYVIDHINGDRADNRIHNLRRCRPEANAKNLRSKGKYVVDKDGCSRWVSGVVKTTL